MTDITTLESLRQRVREASGPDRQIDIAIFKWQYPEYENFIKGRGGLIHPNDGCDARVLSDVRWSPYTASIDAALGLVEKVLPGWRFRNMHTPDKDAHHLNPERWYVVQLCPSLYMSGVTAKALSKTNLPLAILDALLTALIEQERDND